jgi:hypothetical protein
MVTNENFNIGSKFQAMLDICQMLASEKEVGANEHLMIKNLGLWNCNITNSKMSELLGMLRGKINQFEISDCPKELKKQAIKAIADNFLY